MKKYIMALDQGTTSSRTIIFDANQNIVSVSQKEFRQIYPHEGWVEHDPEEIFSTQYETMLESMEKGGICASEIAAVGITNQRETTIVWDKITGKPVSNAIVWQCRRTSSIVDELIGRGLEEHIIKTTGLVPDAYFSATKIKWILDNIPGAREKASCGELLFGTVDTWLIWKLTGGLVHATDYTNASRTMLYDINALKWDETMLRELGIPESMLPEVYPSSHIFGYVSLPDKNGKNEAIVPIAGVAGDQQAALFGQCCFAPGDAKNTYGTGCFMLMNTGKTPIRSKNGLITTIAAAPNQDVIYALEGSVFIGGAVIQWLRDEMAFFADSAESEKYAVSVPDTCGVYLVPAFTGIGAPYWDMYARGIIVGITRGTKREHIIRAALEAIAYQVCDLYSAMEKDTGISVPSLKVDGGASKNGFLMQFESDIMNKNIVLPAINETTALGAASLAGLAVGFWSGTSELAALNNNPKILLPNMSGDKRSALLSGWHKAVGRSLNWAK